MTTTKNTQGVPKPTYTNTPYKGQADGFGQTNIVCLAAWQPRRATASVPATSLSSAFFLPHVILFCFSPCNLVTNASPTWLTPFILPLLRSPSYSFFVLITTPVIIPPIPSLITQSFFFFYHNTELAKFVIFNFPLTLQLFTNKEESLEFNLNGVTGSHKNHTDKNK